MCRSSITALFWRIAVLLITAFGLTGADAEVFLAEWSSPFGTIFPDLGWKGSATFILPDACLGMTGSFANTAPGCGAGDMQVKDAVIQFYNVANPGGILQTLNLESAPPLVDGMAIETIGGVTNLAGVQTGFFGAVQSAIPEAGGYFFHQILMGDSGALVYTLNAFDSPGCALFAVPGSPLCGISQTQAQINFSGSAGQWDPAFGGIFPELGWSGSANFIIPAGCLGLTGSFANSAPGCGGAGMDVGNAQLQLYDVANPGAVLQTLDLGTAPPLVDGMSIETLGGVTNVTGVQTGFFGAVKGAIPEAGNGFYFHLLLTGDSASLIYTADAFDSPGCALFEEPGSSLCGISQPQAQIVFSRVPPEVPAPPTGALFGIGLAALWLMRRRLQWSESRSLLD